MHAASSWPRDSLPLVLIISLLNLDLGFEVCFYDGMTEYAKLWLQFAFPIYLILLTSFLLLLRKHLRCVKRITRHNGNTTMAIILLMSCNKIVAACQSLLLYNCLSYLTSDKSMYLWSVYPSIPLFSTQYLLYFIFCLILVITLIILIITHVFSKKCIERNHFILDAYQGTLKEKHIHWSIIELLLRFITIGFSVLNKQLSVLLNLIALIVFACCLGFTSPFRDKKTTLFECTFTFNLLCIFLCASYYGDSKTAKYYMFVDSFIFIAVIQFVIQVIYHTNANRFNEVYKCMNRTFKRLQKQFKTATSSFQIRI